MNTTMVIGVFAKMDNSFKKNSVFSIGSTRDAPYPGSIIGSGMGYYSKNLKRSYFYPLGCDAKSLMS